MSVCALGAAHVDVQRGRSDNPDERVTLSSSRAGTAGAQRASGRGEDTAREVRGSRSQPALQTIFRTLIFPERDRTSLEGFEERWGLCVLGSLWLLLAILEA